MEMTAADEEAHMDLHSIITAGLTFLLMIIDITIQYVLQEDLIYQAGTILFF